jgi:hypothetical protein
MIGKQKSQYSLLDSVFNRRTKKSRTDTLLKKIDQFVGWRELENLCEPMYKTSKRGKPSLAIILPPENQFGSWQNRDTMIEPL